MLLIGIRSKKRRQLHLKASVSKQIWKDVGIWGGKTRFLGHSSELCMGYIAFKLEEQTTNAEYI